MRVIRQTGVLRSLLDKYADSDITSIESLEVLKLDPLNKLAYPFKIINVFGCKGNYLKVIIELETEIYQIA